LVAWTMAFHETGGNCLQQLVSGRFELEAMGLMVAGVAISLLAAIRLMHLNEEMPPYERIRSPLRRLQYQWTGQGFSGEGDPMPGLRQWFLDRQMAVATAHAQRAGASLWSRVCRWQIGTLGGWQVVPWILGVALLLLLMSWCSGPPGVPMGFFHPLLGIVPGFTAMGMMVQRTRAMNYDLCLPVGRNAYLAQLGTAVALGQFQLWLGLSAVAIAWCLFAAGQRPDVGEMAQLLAASGLVQVWFYGLGVWLARYRSVNLVMAVIVIGIGIIHSMAFGMFMCGPASQRQTFELVVAGLLAIFGVMFAWDAYRRWLVADLG